MEKKLLKRLLSLVLTGGILLSSTGVYTALAVAEETTTSEYTSALVGSDETTTSPETTVSSTTESASSEQTTEVESTTEGETENITESTTVDVQKPATTVSPESTTLPPFVDEEESEEVIIDETPSDNKAEFQWLGVDGSQTNMGSQSNPYAVSSVEHFLAMNEIINDTGFSTKYFQLTADIDFSATTIDSTVLNAQSEYGMEGSLVSVNPTLSSSSVFFYLDGNGKKITNLTIDNDEYASLSIFGYVNSASTIEDLTVNNTSIINSYTDAQAAGIILKNEGTVKECNFTIISIDTTASTTKAESFYPTDDASLRVYSGTALIVDNSGIIDNETEYDSSEVLVLAENVTVKTSRPYAGAVVAQNRGKINKVRARYITVTGDSTKSDYIGGFVGANMTARTSSSTGMYYCEIQKHSSAGGVTGADKIGYLAGYNTGRIHRAKVEGNYKSNSKATDSKYDILVYGGKAAGGIVGDNTGDVQLCTALDIGVYFADETDGAIYGGIVGKTTYGVRNCIATGSTAGAGTAHEITRYIGGIVGYGDTGSNFSVENCYALVKIIDSKADLGAIVGFNGDEAYKNNRIRNVFYSGIISSRPSPVSYGAAGENEGDLTFSKPYSIAYRGTTAGITISGGTTVNASELSFTGWGEASFDVKGNFSATQNDSYYTISGLGTNTITYELTADAKHDKTIVNYDVDITIPSGIGASKEATLLENEPMELGILNSGYVPEGSGTESDPYILKSLDVNFLYYAPAAHFKVEDAAGSTWMIRDDIYSAPSATFWGTVDFNNIIFTYESDKALFKGVYGSRDDSLTNNNSTTHKSTSADDADVVTNLYNGVIKNVVFKVYFNTVDRYLPNIMGNICNATVKNVSVTFYEDSLSSVIASEENTGLFAKAVYGNSYIYGCYVDSAYSSSNGAMVSKIETSYDGVAGFIGIVDAEKTIIDNCGSNILIYATASGIENCSLFIGQIKSLDGGYIQNCYAAGGLIRSSGGSFDSSSCYLFAGNVASSSTEIYNCYFAPSHYYSNNSDGVIAGIKAGSFTGSCKQWSFIAQNQSTEVWGDITLKVSAASDYAYVATIENMDRFDLSDTSNLSQFFEATTSNESTLTPGNFNWFGRVALSYTFAGASGASAVLTVTHNTTGLMAKLTVFNSTDLEIDDDGYYLIKSPIDLYWLSTNQTKQTSGEYLFMGSNSKIKLAADIDMTGHSIEPIGSVSVYFKGEFVAGQDTDGSYYTISNLTFTPDNTDQALFGNVQGATIKGLHLDNASIAGGAYTAALIGTVYDHVTVEDCKITNSSVSGTNHVGALIGGVQNKDENGSTAVIINNCSVENTTVTSTKSEGDFAYIGGMIGAIGRGETADAQYAQITNCTVTDCEISAAARGIGGIVGYARNNQNTIASCTVTGTTITCTGTNGPTYASLGGIAGLFGGSSISKCTVADSTITGECAAGIVTRLTNEAGTTSTISECTVTNSTITSDTIAGGILSQVSNFASDSCYGDKIVDNCKISADTTVKALVSGGIIGNVQQFSDKNLTVSNCTNLGTVETTGKKGSITDGAGGIIGRLQSGLSTSGIQVTTCLSQGTVKGNSNLGGIIGINNASAHTGANKLVKDCYVTSDFSSKNLAVSKGLIIGYVGYSAKSSVSTFAENVVYSSLNTRVPLYGNVEATLAEGGGYDMNMGADQTKGITVDITTTNINSGILQKSMTYILHSIVGYTPESFGNSNVIQLKPNFYVGSTDFDRCGETLTYQYDKNKDGVIDDDTETYTYTATTTAQKRVVATSTPRFSVDNLPSLTGTDGNAFSVPAGTTADPIFTTTASSSKILVGCSNSTGTASATYNKLTDVNIQTFDKKCQAVVKTTYTGIINGETVTFDVGFTVVVDGEHAFEGSGTIDDPFKIYEAEDLLSIKQHHDNPKSTDEFVSNPEFYYEAYYEVMNDIDMTEELATNGYSFAPIGTSDEPFKGHIFSTPGNQFKISNMLIDSTKDYAYSKSYTVTDADGNEVVEYSDALGVFGYTDGAEILDLEFENVTISSVATVDNSFLGYKTGAVVGSAVNTTIQNVEVTGTIDIEVNGSNESYGGRAGAIGGIVGQAGNSTILSDVALRGGSDSESRAEIKGLYQVGGIVGSAADTTGGSITNAVVENANITNLATSGVSIAGGIAGQYSGIITGSETTDDEDNVVQIRNTVNNVTVTGTVVGGVVGSGNINNLVTGGCDLTIEMTDVTNTNVEVTSTVRTDASAGPNGIAGGILGTTHESYKYLIDDCTVDSSTSVISGYCAGGIVGKVESRGVGTMQSEAAMFVTNCSQQATVTQTDAPTSKSLGVSDTIKRGSGAGSVIGVITTNAYTMNQDTMAPQIQIKNVTAGGNISGTFNVGGIVGEFASVQYKLNELTDSLIYDCIVTAKLTALDDATERFGVILGSIEGNQYNDLNPNEQILKQQVPFPEQDANGNTIEYATKPFDKIFYSSYTAGEYNLYGLASVKDYQDPVYSTFFSTIYDVNQVEYVFDEVNPYDDAVDYPEDYPDEPEKADVIIPISIVSDGAETGVSSYNYQCFSDFKYVFSAEIRNKLDSENDSPFGFSISGKKFVLDENVGVDGLSSSKPGSEGVFDVVRTEEHWTSEKNISDPSRFPYTIQATSEGDAELIFTYTNGLQVAIPVVTGIALEMDDAQETRTIKVTNEKIFYYVVKVLPGYSYIQTADLDFSEGSGFEHLKISTSEQVMKTFTGTYDGQNHSITGFNVNIDSAETPVGIFGKVSGVKTDVDGNVIPNVKDLTFINCTVNGGDADQGTGVFAGAVTDGATVSNIKVQNSTATSNVGKLGGAIGTVSGATTLENIEVTGSTVTSAKGSAGGVIGTITEDAVTVTAPRVANTTVTSGTITDGVFAGGATNEDIAGGIVAQGFGTINGGNATDEDGNPIADVETVTVQAFISGGAVGAVYKDNGTIISELTLNDIRVADSDVVAKTTDTTRTGISGAGLLGYARNTTAVKLDNCYVDKASTVYSTGGMAYGAGAVANVSEDVTKLDIIDTETYASVTVSEIAEDDTVYAGGLLGYINNEPSILKIDGSVAGGKITGKAMTTYVAGVIGGFDENINTEITASLFTNGVISAITECIDGTSANVTLKSVHRYGKFIARYGADMFNEDSFATYFADNYYSTYPQDISFFSSESGESSYEALITEDMFKDINIQGNLIIADEYESSWNSVAITKNIGSETTLFAKLDKYAELPYGSKDAEGNFTKISTAAGGFYLVETAEDEEGNKVSCIDLVGEIDGIENEETGIVDKYQLTVKPTGYGAEMLVAEYTCGLQTTGTVLSVEIKGAGTEADPYLISTPTQLRVVAYLAKGRYYFRQINDIDLSDSYNANSTDTDKFIHYNGGKGTAPIGTTNAPFDGVYDGQGYKITGLKIERKDESNIGLFGVVAQNGTLVPTIRNVHLELMAPTTVANGIVGNENVGGIAGNISNAVIENCSVTVGNVTGKNNVGGIVGNFTSSKVENCFTQSDVNAFGESKPYAGGIVGYVNDAVNFESTISGCFASGSIYATPISTTGGNDKSNAAGIVSYVANSTELVIDNCLFTGTTASGYGILAGAGALNMVLTVTDCIDAGQNVAMAAGDIFNLITNAVAPTTLAGSITKSGLYYDSSLLRTDTTNYPDSDTGFTGKSTTDLLSGNVMSAVVDEEGNPLWSKTKDHYPTPVVSGIKVVNYNEAGQAIDVDGNVIDDVASYLENLEATPDPYSQAYAKFLSAPVQISEEEECNDISNSAYGKGLVYPVTLLTNIGDSEVTYSSSIFDTTDTGDYPEGFDTKLYGKPVLDDDGNVTRDESGNIISNKNVDLLFEDKDTGYTSVYRNIFDTTKNIANKANFEEIPTKNTYVNAGAASGNVFSNGEAYYNAQVPVIFATAEIDGVRVQRDIKIPLSYGTTYCIATQRQLYALGGNEADKGANHKFSDYYGSAKNYKLITDIDCTDLKDAEGNSISFVPIGYSTDSAATGYTGQFNGSKHKITGLTIDSTGKDYVGFFSKLSFNNSGTEANQTTVKDLTLENATVNGANYVGTLVGYVESSGVIVENCHAIGEIDYKFTYVEAEKGDYVWNEDGGEYVLAEEKGTGTHNREYERDANDNYILDVDNAKGKVTGTGSYVGGLIGKVAVDAATIGRCSATVLVEGNDSVGGLIGESNGTIEECFATGNVICEKLIVQEDSGSDIRGAGGLIGVMSGGSVEKSFASGNVEVKQFGTNITRGNFGIGGFVGYVYEVTEEVKISECFSGGNVSVGTADAKSTVFPANGQTVIVGIGGFSGINYAAINNVYSSATITTDLEDITQNTSSSWYTVGVGGVCGVALENVTNIYSSGSVTRPVDRSKDSVEPENCYYGVGGTIGTTGSSDAECNYCYYDGWTNNIPGLTSIGGKSDKTTAMSLTTTDLTKGKKPSGVWSSAWGYTAEAYPYLKSLLNENVDDHIKTNAILSVVRVTVEDDDVSAKSGRGLTMSLTVSDTFVYTDTDTNEEYKYELVWSGANYDNVTKQAAMTRTQNIQETIDLVVLVSKCYINGEIETDDKGNAMDYTEYASRIYSRLCAEMRGTLAQPYLIGNEIDLAHVNMTATELDTAKTKHPDFYGQWATPIDGDGNPIEGTVHYQLSLSIELTGEHCDACGETVNALSIGYDPSVADNYEGFALIGNGYQIRTAEGVEIGGCYIENVDADSTIANVLFDLEFADPAENGSAAIINANNGTLQDVYAQSTIGSEDSEISNVAGLVVTNNGEIDGCIVDATIMGAKSNLGVMAITNNGKINNSGTAGTLDTATGDTASNIGAFVVNNKGSITNSFSMADIDVNTAESATVENISGFVAENSGTIDGVYTRSAISFAKNPGNNPKTVASLVSTIASIPEDVTEPITNAYAAGLLGYFNSEQDSILFGDAGNMPKLSSVYVDKSLAGVNSKDSFKYSASLSSIMDLKYMENTQMQYTENNLDGKFVAGGELDLVLPQLATILNLENNEVVDAEGRLLYIDEAENLYYYDDSGETGDDSSACYVDLNGNKYTPVSEDENGVVIVKDSSGNELSLILRYDDYINKTTIIRNHDIIKAYSEVSSMVFKTAYSTYADALVANSTSTTNYGTTTNSKITEAEGIKWSKVDEDNDLFNVRTYTGAYDVTTAELNDASDLDETLVASKLVSVKRGLSVQPKLLIDIAISDNSDVANPNFIGKVKVTDENGNIREVCGIGTKDRPYVITDAASLMSLHYYGTESELYFVLGNDIDMSGVDDFQIHVFTAHLNDPESVGDDTHQYTIENFTSTKGEGGLFGRVEADAVINNVALTGKIIGSEQYIGALANRVNGGTITNCVVAADVTSTCAETGAATGVLAGRVTENAVISGIITTGNADAAVGAVGGVIGYAENATMSEFLSTANVGEGEEVAGIVGTMGENATLTNVLYGGVADSKKPVVASYVDENAITNAYYDTQLNKGIEEGTVIGEGRTTKECESLTFEGAFEVVDPNGGYYSVPDTIVSTIGLGGGSTTYESYGSTAALAAATMNFYLGSSRGSIGFYTSMRFEDYASGSQIDAYEVYEDGSKVEDENDKYFKITPPDNNTPEDTTDDLEKWLVNCLRYDESLNPAIILEIPNGAKRTICPGLTQNANVKYKIIADEDIYNDVNGKTLGVLLKSASGGEDVYVLNDFTKEVNSGKDSGELLVLDSFIIDSDEKGFYVSEMLPKGYEFEVDSITLNEDIDIIGKVEYKPEMFINLDNIEETDLEGTTDNYVDEFNIEIILKIVRDDAPWGVNSKSNTLW